MDFRGKRLEQTKSNRQAATRRRLDVCRKSPSRNQTPVVTPHQHSVTQKPAAKCERLETNASATPCLSRGYLASDGQVLARRPSTVSRSAAEELAELGKYDMTGP